MNSRRHSRHDCWIEHRGPHGKTVLADPAVLLAPLAAGLESEGQSGDLVVVDAASGETVVRWPLSAPARGSACPRPPAPFDMA